MPIDQGLIDIAWYGVVSVALALLLAIGLWIFRLATSMPGIAFLAGRDKRLGIVEQVALDGRRRLVLIRRDGVEHLLMTGGAIDLVVEMGIGENRDRPARQDRPVERVPHGDELIRIADNPEPAQTRQSSG
jgi:flagellar protein FliO/FliZ